MQDVIQYAPVAEVVALLGVAVIAYWQLHAYREDAKKRNTLDALTRFSTDPLLAQARRHLMSQVPRRNGEQSWEHMEVTVERKSCANRILNYLEVIAHGYREEYLDKDTVEEEFKKSIMVWGGIFLGENRKARQFKRSADDEKSSFPHLLTCYKEWKKQEGRNSV